jgi:hypothetical protein
LKSGNRQSRTNESIDRFLRDRGKPPPEGPRGLHERLAEAFGQGADAAFDLMLSESALIRQIREIRADFRWVALRCPCTFRKPNLLEIMEEKDDIREALDSAKRVPGLDGRVINGLHRRYRKALLSEALVTASSRGDRKQALRMIDLGADVNAITARGETALTAAASGGFGSGVIRLLLAHGAGKNGDLEEALEIATRCRHHKNIRALNIHKKDA